MSNKPTCPKCEKSLFVMDRQINVYELELENDDPSLPCPGAIRDGWGDESYHPHYYCLECGTNYSFSEQKPIPDVMLGRDDEPLWLQDDIQFCRLLAEICATDLHLDGDSSLLESMDITPEDLDALLERAQQKWEVLKAQLTLSPVVVNKNRRAATIVNEEMEKALKAIDDRMQAERIYPCDVTDALACNIDALAEGLRSGDFDLEPEENDGE